MAEKKKRIIKPDGQVPEDVGADGAETPDATPGVVPGDGVDGGGDGI